MTNDPNKDKHRMEEKSANRKAQPKRIIFPDTNLFLHFPPMREIEWLKLANAKSVELVICMTVIKELDAKKSDSRLASRAERAIKEIRDARGASGFICDGLTLSIFNREIRNADFSESLSPDSADDRIVHFAKIYLNENPGDSVAIATGDMGMELRAEAGGIDLIALGPELRLENPLDEERKKHREAITELNSLKNRFPKLSIGLSLPTGEFAIPHTVSFDFPPKESAIEVDAEMANVRRRYPKYSKPDKTASKDYRSPSSSFTNMDYLMDGMIDEKEWPKYNTQLDDFYEEYENHLFLIKKLKDIQRRSFRFDLWLANDGNSLASNIDVQIAFPNDLRVFEKESKDCRLIETLPEPPEPPKRPKPYNYFESRQHLYDPIANLGLLARQPNISEIVLKSRYDEWSPQILVTDGQPNKVEIRLGKLKHGHNIRLGTFLVVYETVSDIKTFGASFVLSCSDLPKMAKDKLPFQVNLNKDKRDECVAEIESTENTSSESST